MKIFHWPKSLTNIITRQSIQLNRNRILKKVGNGNFDAHETWRCCWLTSVFCNQLPAILRNLLWQVSRNLKSFQKKGLLRKKKGRLDLEMNSDYEKTVLWFLVMDYDQMPKNRHCEDLILISQEDLDALIGRILNHVFREDELTKPTLIK